MAFSLILVLLVLMAAGGSRRGRKSVSKRTRDDEGSDPDYRAEEEEAVEEAEEEAEEEEEEVEEPVSHHDKGKGIAGESSRGGGSRAQERRSKRMGDISSERLRAYSTKSCIAERHVNFRDLTEQVPDFRCLLLRAPIESVGNVGVRTPFCVELIREFYMRGVILAVDEETGTYLFKTTVRGKRLTVTPHDIGDLLGMVVDVSGLHYTAGPFQSSTHWDTVIDAICRPGARTDRSVVESKDLRPEYHLLSLIMSYNV